MNNPYWGFNSFSMFVTYPFSLFEDVYTHSRFWSIFHSNCMGLPFNHGLELNDRGG